MLVVHKDGRLEHARVRDLPNFVRSGDVVVVNDTKVVPARLHGHRLPRANTETAGAKIELMLHKRTAADRFLALARPAKRLAAGDRLQLGRSMFASVLARHDAEVEVQFDVAGVVLDRAIAREGEIPLPPYIVCKRKPDMQDASDYQTVFAEHAGSAAAPTAGLHFTPELFTQLEKSCVASEKVTLHVGAGTFLPVTARDTTQHRMHAEWATVSAQTADRLNRVRDNGGCILAVGTTSLRTLETAARAVRNRHWRRCGGPHALGSSCVASAPPVLAAERIAGLHRTRTRSSSLVGRPFESRRRTALLGLAHLLRR
jgi:S-adenosylmethionine:tRNA ribosyltransferase-isomerase